MSNVTREPVVLAVILAPDGKLDVTGPIANRPLCMQMIAEALKLIAVYEPKQVVAATQVPSLPKNGEAAPGLRLVP